MSASPVDQVTLESLRELMEDEFEELVANYLEDTQILLDKIEAAVADSNADTIQKEAHAMKSSSANMGANAMSEIARELETIGRTGNADGAAEAHARAAREFARVKDALSVELQDS